MSENSVDLRNKGGKMADGVAIAEGVRTGAKGVGAVAEATSRLESASAKLSTEDPIQAAARRAAAQVKQINANKGPEASINALASNSIGGAPAEAQPTPGFTPQETAGLQAVKDRFPGGVDQTAAEPSPVTANGGGPPKPPEAPTAVGAQPNGEQPPNQREVTATSGVQDQDRSTVYEGMPASRLQNTSNRLQRRIDSLNRRADRAANNAEWENFQGQINQLEDEISIIEEIQNERGDEIDETSRSEMGERGAGRQTREEMRAQREEISREAREELEALRELNKFSTEELNVERQGEDGVLKALKIRLDGATPAEKNDIKKLISKSESRLKGIDSLLETRGPEKTAAERQAQEAQDKINQERLINAKAANPTEDDIQNFRDNITNLRGDVSGSERRLADLERAIDASPGDASLIEQRRELVKSLLDSRNRLSLYESALETATAKRNKAEDEFDKLESEDKVKKLLELGAKGKPLSRDQYKDLCNKFKRGEITAEQMGKLAVYIGKELAVAKKPDREMIANLTELNRMSAEFALAVLGKFEMTKEGDAKIRELFPDPKGWEKIKKLAGKSKGLLALILALLGLIGTVLKTAGSAFKDLPGDLANPVTTTS